MSLKVNVWWSTVGRQGSRSPSQRRAAFPPGGAAVAACEPLLCSKHAQLRNPCLKRHQNYSTISALPLAFLCFYLTQVQSLSALVIYWLNDCLTYWYCQDLIDVTLACEDANTKQVEVVTVLMLMLRNVLTTVWCKYGSWSLVIKLNFYPDFEHKVWSRFLSWSSGESLKLKFGRG